MTWYFNFCAPAIPNDATINFHRGFQTAELMTLLILFVLYHTYYKLCGPDPLSETQGQNESNENESKKDKEQEKSNSDEKSVREEEKSENEDIKSVSIAEKIRHFGDENQSYVSFKTGNKSMKSSGDKFLKKNKPAGNAPKTSQALDIKENVSAHEIESYFPIVFGHHAIAMGASIMYSPYAEQSLASILYVLFSFVLAMVNSKRMRRTTFGVWIFMAFLNVFIMMSALLEVGQSNWDFVNNVCFAEEYISLY